MDLNPGMDDSKTPVFDPNLQFILWLSILDALLYMIDKEHVNQYFTFHILWIVSGNSKKKLISWAIQNSLSDGLMPQTMDGYVLS